MFLDTSRLTESAEQTFGVDLEARARTDRKRVPIVVTTILTFLDNREWNHSQPRLSQSAVADQNL